jgi:hypothetical protein
MSFAMYVNELRNLKVSNGFCVADAVEELLHGFGSPKGFAGSGVDILTEAVLEQFREIVVDLDPDAKVGSDS